MMAAVRWPWAVAGGLGAAALVAWLSAGYFGHELLAQIAILAILAMSLDLLVGYTGLVSLGHAAFYGIGAYAAAVVTVFWDGSGWAAIGFAIVAAALAAMIIGALAVRLAGVFFIMITLALGEMVHAYIFVSPTFGGDDGLSGIIRPDFGPLGLDANDPAHFSALTLIVAGLVFLGLNRIVHSPFGRVLAGIHANPARMQALGCPVLVYKLAAFILAGAIAGLAGALAAQHSQFVSPELLTWTMSGEVLIVVIVGGLGSLIGPAAGAAAVVLLTHYLSGGTEYWMFWMGLFFIAVVLFAGDGLYGRLDRCRVWLGHVAHRRSS